MYLLGTGYFNGNPNKAELEWFARLWLHNTVIWPDRLPERIVAISMGNSGCPYKRLAQEMEIQVPIDVLELSGNLGHIHQLIGKQLPKKDNRHCGAVGGFMALASIAYCNECDFVYKEQDCLWFGQAVWALYEAVGPTRWGMAFGKLHTGVSSAQSLFIVKHWMIPEFIKMLIEEGDERDITNLPEDKFTRMLSTHPHQVKQFDFGYDRDRPFDVTDEVFYCQKLSIAELQQLERANLLDFPSIPPTPASGAFTNDVTDRFK